MGPIGANGLANPRDFKAPVAWFDKDKFETSYTIYNKFSEELFEYEQDHTCFDVVAWHGSYYPYKYDLNDFIPVNSVLKDHMDPSIFTVL